VYRLTGGIILKGVLFMTMCLFSSSVGNYDVYGDAIRTANGERYKVTVINCKYNFVEFSGDYYSPESMKRAFKYHVKKYSERAALNEQIQPTVEG
jgi:hypothetical protein